MDFVSRRSAKAEGDQEGDLPNSHSCSANQHWSQTDPHGVTFLAQICRNSNVRSSFLQQKIFALKFYWQKVKTGCWIFRTLLCSCCSWPLCIFLFHEWKSYLTYFIAMRCIAILMPQRFFRTPHSMKRLEGKSSTKLIYRKSHITQVSLNLIIELWLS